MAAAASGPQAIAAPLTEPSRGSHAFGVGAIIAPLATPCPCQWPAHSARITPRPGKAKLIMAELSQITTIALGTPHTMSISHYIKDIARGKKGARPLDREQAHDLFSQVLSGEASDLEIGAFWVAMRIKGETLDEMLGFLEASRDAMALIAPAASGRPTVVIGSYNGARRFPVLTPLLAALLTRAGCRVILHGFENDPQRVTSANVLAAMGCAPVTHLQDLSDTAINFVPIEVLCPPLAQLLQVRRVLGLRSSAHSLVKLLNPCAEAAVVIGSYTHPEYYESMDELYRASHACALLLRGLEGEAVADARRLQRIDAYVHGQHSQLQAAQTSAITTLPDWPTDISAASTAAYIQAVLHGDKPVPPSIANQVDQILHITEQMQSPHPSIV